MDSSGFKYYPFPILFYALQYSNTDFIKRIGQDYAYCEDLSDHLVGISENIKKAYFNISTPTHIKENILLFYSELLIVLKAEHWQQFFLQVWDTKLKNNALFIDLRRRENDFILKGLSYIEAPQIMSKVISD